MSTLYLGSDLESLAGRLADAIAGARGDFFAPTLIVVPNRFLRKWLRLWLARRLGVAINFDFQSLDDALWLLLRRIDPHDDAQPLDDNTQRLLVLSALLEERDPELSPLQRYAQLEQPLSRLAARRGWQLADRLGALLLDYEQHRHDALIRRWLDDDLALSQAADFYQLMERAQRALFQHIVRRPGGRQAWLDRAGGCRFRTLAQYALESMSAPPPTKRGSREMVHFFGLTQIAALHVRTLAWLAGYFDLHIYHVNAAASRIRGTLTTRSLQSVAQGLRDTSADDGADAGRAALRLWGRTGAEALTLTAELLIDRHFRAEVVPPTAAAAALVAPGETKSARARKPGPTVLQRLQDQLLGRARNGAARLPQDTSVQIVACPGLTREVETVYNSILFNLQRYPQLRQTDVAVLVTDMARYRPILQAVFERPPQHLQYNLVDFSAAGLSAMGQGLLDMLDLALESFTRSRVFQVLLNPCFLARLGVERPQALAWLDWAQTLGIYRGWDADERQGQGYPRSPFYAWRLGLQRLRLGRFMEVVGDDNAGPAPRFGHIIPFADLTSSDREQLDSFCRAVEGLLPLLARLRHLQADGRRWSAHLQRLLGEFLDVPADRPEEAQVREELDAACARLARWDDLRDPATPQQGLPLALVREYIHSQLEKLEGSRGEYLVGGVTLAALAPMRPVAFPLIYVMGLSDDIFPGSNALSSFDLRGAGRLPGDVRPAEEKTYEFLEAILCARQKLYLLYNHHDMQRDQALQPALPLVQLQDFLSSHVVKEPFEPQTMPLDGSDDTFFCTERQPEFQDVLVQHREVERMLAFVAAQRERRWQPDLNQQAELNERRATLAVDFVVTPEPAARGPTVVTLAELKRFLVLPAQESLRRHLRVDEHDEPELEDDEPLVTPPEAGGALVRQTLQHLVRSSCRAGAEQALAGWGDYFNQVYADSRLRCRVPDDAFGAIDQETLRRTLAERIHGSGALEDFLRKHERLTVCGPLLIGASPVPIGARYRFPALSLPLEREVRLVGSTPFAWCARNRFEILIVTHARAMKGQHLSPYLFEPVLLYCALLANTTPGPRGISPQAWMARRDLHVHVAHRDGIQSWFYPAGTIEPAEAHDYVLTLARDLLNETEFDLLPFDIIAGNVELNRAYSEQGTPVPAEQYRQLLAERIDEAREGAFRAPALPPLVEMIRAQVPGDALAKIRRRFLLLDRGPARKRQQPPVSV